MNKYLLHVGDREWERCVKGASKDNLIKNLADFSSFQKVLLLEFSVSAVRLKWNLVFQL